jgi:5,10-methylenetetrahydromethanopterin reductase
MTWPAISVAFDGLEPARAAVGLAREAEQCGLQGIWIADHMGYRDTLMSAMAILNSTERLRVIPTALSPYIRHPVPAAMAVATLEEYAPGRNALAVGMGNPLFLREAGIDAHTPLKAVQEYVSALRELWTGQPVATVGSHVNLAGARLGFGNPRGVPVYVAAIRPKMVALGASFADGVVFSSGLSVDALRASVDSARRARRAAAAEASRVYLAGYVIASSSDNGRVAVEACRNKLAFVLRNHYLQEAVASSAIEVDQQAIIAAISRRDIAAAAAVVPDAAVDEFCAAGTAAQVISRLEAYASTGVDELILVVVGDQELKRSTLQTVRESGRR